MGMKSDSFHIFNRRYLGSKSRLVPFIEEVVHDYCRGVKTVADIFAGTGSVAWAFDGSHRVIVNDLLFSNYVAYVAWFSDEEVDSEKLSKKIAFFNSLDPGEDNYFSNNFSDTYFSRKNCRKIGAIRGELEREKESGELNKREFCILLTSLLYAMDHIANTVGHYDAYRKDGDTDKELVLKNLDLTDPKVNEGNSIYREDANELVRHIKADLVYIDPPYNSRQYCDAYHLLENVAQWTKPEVYGVARKMKRSDLKSKYCTNSAPKAFEDLIENIDARYILVSYNNMGTKGNSRSQAKISDEEIVRALSTRGKVQCFEKSFTPFTAGKSHIDNHKERLFLCTVGKHPSNRALAMSVSSGVGIPSRIKSPLNYTGGKYRLIPQLELLFPKEIGTFIDLFGGGFNVGVNIPAERYVYNDRDRNVESLIKLFQELDGQDLIKRLERLQEKYSLSDSYSNSYEFYGCESSAGLGRYNKPGYERLRKDYNSGVFKGIDRRVALLLLVVYSFNNQIRFNSSGEFNMPVGKRDLNSQMRKHILSFCQSLHSMDVEWLSADFRKIDPSRYPDPFVYCDPPYLLGNAAYNESGGWSEKDDRDLMDYLSDLDSKGIRFALSNVLIHKRKVNEPLKRWAETNKFKVHIVKSDYSNSSYHLKDRGQETEEVLITSYR